MLGSIPIGAKYLPSKALAHVIGEKELSRLSTQKAIWAYIKKNNLVVGDRSVVVKLDAPLKGVFGPSKSVNIYKVTKVIGKNLRHIKGPGKSSKLYD